MGIWQLLWLQRNWRSLRHVPLNHSPRCQVDKNLFLACLLVNNQNQLILLFYCPVLQCNIAHALEKTKYADSDINWKKFDEKYHFSCQFTTDILAMNHADFIITSTYQEIAGRSDTLFSSSWKMSFLLAYVFFSFLEIGYSTNQIGQIPCNSPQWLNTKEPTYTAKPAHQGSIITLAHS